MKRFKDEDGLWVRCDCGHVQAANHDQYRGNEPVTCEDCGESDYV